MNTVKHTYPALLTILITMMIFSTGVNNSFSQVTDIDGNTYKTVIIGSQEWLAENLNVEHYRNGDIIPQVQDGAEWKKLNTGAWCYYKNDTAIGKTFGKLYNWYAVNDPRGLAPDGWHIPGYTEWKQLTDTLGGDTAAGGKLKANTLWESPNEGATNSSGFSAIPGGIRDVDGFFYIIDKFGYFWAATEYNSDLAWFHLLYYYFPDVYRIVYKKTRGMSVRCVRD